MWVKPCQANRSWWNLALTTLKWCRGILQFIVMAVVRFLWKVNLFSGLMHFDVEAKQCKWLIPSKTECKNNNKIKQ
jgi:hypothetical protein